MTHTDIPKPAAGRRTRDPKGTRERLVRAALELFTTQGYHSSTTPQIAKRAGVAEGTIYRHFTSKEQLLNEIYRGAVKFFTQFVAESPSLQTCRERMEGIAESWKQVASQDPSLVKLVFVSPPTTLLDSQSQTAFQALRGEVEKIIASGKAAGEVRTGPVDIWADVWLQLIRLLLQRLANREWQPDQSSPKQVVDAAWDAIAAPSVRTGS